MTAAFEVPLAVGAPALAAVAGTFGIATAFGAAAVLGLLGLNARHGARHPPPHRGRRGERAPA